MKEFFPIIRSSQLFSGVSEEELTAMLSCLETRKESFPKDALLLRIGDTADAIGLVLSGSILIIQEDIWGNRNIISKAGVGQTFAAAYACAPGLCAECKRCSRNSCYGAVFEHKACAACVFLRLHAS